MVPLNRQLTGGVLYGLAGGLLFSFLTGWTPWMLIAAFLLIVGGSVLTRPRRADPILQVVDLNPDRMTDRLKRVLAEAEAAARVRLADQITPEDLLLGLSRGDRGVGRTILDHLAIHIDQMQDELAQLAKPDHSPHTPAARPLSPESTHILAWAKEEARSLNHNYLGTEHLVLGLLRDGQSPASDWLRRHRASLDDARKALRAILG